MEARESFVGGRVRKHLKVSLPFGIFHNKQALEDPKAQVNPVTLS